VAARPAGPELAARVGDRLERVRGRITDERLHPGPLTQPEVLARMREQKLFGPSTLEEYATCPYRWFVNHELKPQETEPEGEALAAGSVAHSVLEQLYRDPPAGTKRATAETLPEWLDRARELVAELGAERLPSGLAETAATRRRVEGLVLAFLRDEAAAGAPFQPDADLTEASFGFDEEEGGKPPLMLAGGGVHGRIDRIDIGPGGEALVQDYKSGAKIEGGAGMLDKGKFQLQLYMLAARELWELELAGGLYIPLGGTSQRVPKGLLRKELKGDLAPLRPRDRDHLPDEKFEAALGDARAKAEGIIAAVQAGRIGRDPIGGSCPEWCDFQPICRRERGLPEEEPEAEGEPELME
jgi:RecB family exonuclease